MTSLRRVLAVFAAVALALSGAVSALAVTDPLDGPYPQVHGELVPQVPATATCTNTIVTDFPFHNTAYQGDPPFTGSYVPTCAGPWSKVVLTTSVKVKTGTQFDRIGDVLIGGVEMLHLTTAEGESGETDWTIDRDVTQYASLFSSTQPTYFIIGNQTDGTYTGDFYGTLTLSFYGPGVGAPATTGADKVLSLTPYLNRGTPTLDESSTASHTPDVLTAPVTVPVNATALTAEVFTSGHGSEEEDWWNAPFVCVSGGIPYREVAVYVDGQLAGTAPIFPTLFTGGYGPDFWRPIPSPRTFNLRPYTFDLSPWIGQLTDGASHSIAMETLGQGGCSGYWWMSGNLLVTTSRTTTGRTTGGITAYAADALPTSTSTVGVDSQPSTVSDMTTSKHHLDITGTVKPADALVPTSVHVVQDMTNSATDAALDVVSNWTWDSSSTRTTGASSVADSQSSTYQLIRTGPTWTFQDNQSTAHSVNGSAARTTTMTDSMTSAGPVVGITGVVGSQQESWKYSTSDGYCVDHELASSAQNTVLDQVSATCPLAVAAPSVDLPDAPVALLLPLAGLAAGVTARRVRRSRRASR